jgi:2-oxoglutarate ferredoxin oxidoreductase subunit delta
MIKIKGAVVVNTDRCKGCALCVQACPNNVLVLSKKKVNIHGYSFVEPLSGQECIGCKSCAIVCPDACISVYKKRMEA